MSRYQLTPAAQSNLEAIADFIAEESLDAAIRVIDASEQAFQRLAEVPSYSNSAGPGVFDQGRSDMNSPTAVGASTPLGHATCCRMPAWP